MKGIIFDLDGVICSTDQYHYLAWKEMADQIDVYFDEEINYRLRGVGRMESLDIILEKSEKTYTKEEKEQLAKMKNEKYVEFLQKMTEKDLSDEVKNTLLSLRARGLKLAIGSSSKNTKLILSRIGLSDFFDAISDGTNIVNSKPDPEVFLKAAAFLHLSPEDCLVVEDAKAGIEAAKRGGFMSAGILDACNHPDVTYKLSTFEDLLKI